jgi:flavin reductase (DIM6/NTAB) family NADH-FMN oxidoreductase RutF
VEVKSKRIMECPIQIEARILNIRVPDYSPFFAIVEVQAMFVHAHEEIMLNDNHVNPQKWSPLIYNFRHYFGLGGELGKTFRSET